MCRGRRQGCRLDDGGSGEVIIEDGLAVGLGYGFGGHCERWYSEDAAEWLSVYVLSAVSQEQATHSLLTAKLKYSRAVMVGVKICAVMKVLEKCDYGLPNAL